MEVLDSGWFWIIVIALGWWGLNRIGGASGGETNSEVMGPFEVRLVDEEVGEESKSKVKAVDSTAAGDCFNGALATLLSQGHSLPNSISFANRAAAVSVTRMGAQTSLPFIDEVKD